MSKLFQKKNLPKQENIILINLVMKLNLKILITLALVVLIYSCQEVDRRKIFYNEQGLLVKRLYYPDSVSIKIERTFKNDTIPHGYGKAFYPSGQLELYIEYVDGKKHGTEMEFYHSGIKRKLGRNKKGKSDSTWIWYDSLGRIEQKNYWDNGIISGNQTHYYSNGKLKKCLFYNPLGDAVYTISFDKDGTKISEEGDKKPFVVIKTLHSIYEWKVGEIFLAQIYLCLCESKSTSIALYDRTNSLLLETIQLEQDNFLYSKKLSKPGEYRLSIEYTDSLIVKTDFTVK